eukprot:13797346-Ditylum_brightwellii.AAC.1
MMNLIKFGEDAVMPTAVAVQENKQYHGTNTTSRAVLLALEARALAIQQVAIAMCTENSSQEAHKHQASQVLRMHIWFHATRRPWHSKGKQGNIKPATASGQYVSADQ